MDFRLQNANVVGLQQFEIENFDLRIFGLSLAFEIRLPQLTIDGTHSTNTTFGTTPLSGTGPMSMTLNGVTVSGAVQMRILQGGYLNIRNMEIGIQMESAVVSMRGFNVILDPVISVAMSLALPAMINESNDQINELITENILPDLNERLKESNILDMIISIILSLFGGEITSMANESMIREVIANSVK